MGWNDHWCKAFVTNYGSVAPGQPANKKRQRAEDGRNYYMPVPRPSHLEHYYEISGCVDRHNRHRQSVLKLHKIWKTKRWETRMQTEVLGTSMVDAYLTCRWLMPKWRDRDDCESNFLAFVNEVVLQIDGRTEEQLDLEMQLQEAASPSAPVVWNECALVAGERAGVR